MLPVRLDVVPCTLRDRVESEKLFFASAVARHDRYTTNRNLITRRCTCRLYRTFEYAAGMVQSRSFHLKKARGSQVKPHGQLLRTCLL